MKKLIIYFTKRIDTRNRMIDFLINDNIGEKGFAIIDAFSVYVNEGNEVFYANHKTLNDCRTRIEDVIRKRIESIIFKDHVKEPNKILPDKIEFLFNKKFNFEGNINTSKEETYTCIKSITETDTAVPFSDMEIFFFLQIIGRLRQDYNR